VVSTEFVVTQDSIPLIYIDTNVISDVATSKLNPKDIFSACGCETAIFAFSEYSVREAVRGVKPEFIAARALTIDSLAGLWIPDIIRQRDIGFIEFLTRGDPQPIEIPLYASFAELLRDANGFNEVQVRANYSAAHEACLKISGRGSDAILDPSMQSLESTRVGLKNSDQQHLDVVIDFRIAESVIERYQLVLDNPLGAGKVFVERSNLYRICAAAEIEYLLNEFRASDALHSQQSNSYDFLHLATSLGVADFFVTKDREAIAAAEFVSARSQHKIAAPINTVSPP
jgi:hypothetical protein